MNILLATIPLMIAIIMLAGLPLYWLMAAQKCGILQVFSWNAVRPQGSSPGQTLRCTLTKE